MANTDLLIPILVASIGLIGSLISLLFTWRATRRAHEMTVSILVEKYTPPLLVAAYDLQQRIYELVEYPISRQHLTKEQGLVDLKIYTCYLLAQFLAFSYILRVKTGYLSFSKNRKFNQVRSLLYVIENELDQRHSSKGKVGVWPADRLLISERMVDRTGSTSTDALDGGLGIDVKGFDDFQKRWLTDFTKPMGYFCECVDSMLKLRMGIDNNNANHLRCLQHLLVDLVGILDDKKMYIRDIRKSLTNMKCRKSNSYCDCSDEDCQDNKKWNRNRDEAIEFRHNERLFDPGLWSPDGKNEDNRGFDKRKPEDIDLEKAMSYTYSHNLD